MSVVPLLLLALTRPAPADWGEVEPDGLANRLAVETALEANGVAPESASAVVATTLPGPVVRRYDRVRGVEHLVPTTASAVSRIQLGATAETVSSRIWYSEDGRLCTDLMPAEQRLPMERLTAISPFDPAPDETHRAQLLVGSQPEGSTMLTWLGPGEQVTMVQAENTTRRRRVERLDLHQSGRRLVVVQDEGGTRACYLPD